MHKTRETGAACPADAGASSRASRATAFRNRAPTRPATGAAACSGTSEGHSRVRGTRRAPCYRPAHGSKLKKETARGATLSSSGYGVTTTGRRSRSSEEARGSGRPVSGSRQLLSGVPTPTHSRTVITSSTPSTKTNAAMVSSHAACGSTPLSRRKVNRASAGGIDGTSVVFSSSMPG
jgi:hypothetical protein